MLRSTNQIWEVIGQTQILTRAGNQTAPGLTQPAQNVSADTTCFDEEAGCPAWAEGDGCIQTGPGFMLEKCRRSCQVCGQPYTRRAPGKVTTYPASLSPITPQAIFDKS